MPFQSEKQRRYLWANEPEIARDWTDTYGSRVKKFDGGEIYKGIEALENPMNYLSLSKPAIPREGFMDYMAATDPAFGRVDTHTEYDTRYPPRAPQTFNRYGWWDEVPSIERYQDPERFALSEEEIIEEPSGINQVPNQFKNMYWGPSQGDEAGNVWEEPAPKPFTFPGIIGLIQSLARGAGKKLGMTQVSDADRTANEAFMAGANPWSQETELQITRDPQTGRMIGGDFAGRNVPGTSGWGSANFGEMAQSWMDKYGEMAYKSDKMKEKKKRIAKIARDHQRKLQQEREQTIKDYSTWTSPRGRDHVTSGGIGSPESRRGGAPGTSKGEASWKGYQGGRVPLAAGNFLGLPQHYQNTDQLRAATRAGLISEPQYKEMSGHDAAENVWGLGSLMGPLQPYTNVAASTLYNVDKSIRNPQDYFDPNTYQPRVGPMESIDMNVKGAIEGLSPELQEKYEGILDLDRKSLTGNWMPEDLYDFSGVDDDDETGIIDPSNPQLNKAGLGVMSFLGKKFGPKIAAFIKNRALSKVGKTIGPKIRKTGGDIINPPKTPHGGGGWHPGVSGGGGGIGSAASRQGPAGGSVGASRFR